MKYQGPTKFELLVLITKYNLAHPTDKIKPQVTDTIKERDSKMVNEFLAQEATSRAQYPYNSFQRQAQRLQPLLEKVLALTNFDSYNELDWMELLIAVNDMLKLVRSKMQETQKLNSERIQKDLERRKAEYAIEKLQRAEEEQKKVEKAKPDKELAEKAKQAVAAEQSQACPPPKVRRPNKLQKKPNPLICPNEVLKTKEQKIEIPDVTAALSTSPKAPDDQNAGSTTEVPVDIPPPLPPRCPYPTGNAITTNSEASVPPKPTDTPEAKFYQVPGCFPDSPPPLPPRKDTPRDPARAITPPTRPVLHTRSRSKEDPKKKVSFNGTEVDRTTVEDTVMTGMDMPGNNPEAQKDESLEILSVIQPEEVCPEEKVPKRKKGTEPEHHQRKMDKAHYDALRVASEIRKFSWPGVGGK
ncbi:hypothetical protein ONS95_008324 [Cadophora gregata]|uniref:uncharacterized protein n=1 Tax=Cadophora gregata TaxID=51156 RepID=UPI0026DD969F|nr:uncharacterized protein ONS95_008324 [Cadophora gregata]KAK0100370.1 hypothetical protein ONS96_007650 [Cadophora gregata f. sp. sojae]KAK0126744.1 hypothetical protein ONS95_008324 [Cadophora gregata]